MGKVLIKCVGLKIVWKMSSLSHVPWNSLPAQNLYLTTWSQNSNTQWRTYKKYERLECFIFPRDMLEFSSIVVSLAHIHYSAIDFPWAIQAFVAGDSYIYICTLTVPSKNCRSLKFWHVFVITAVNDWKIEIWQIHHLVTELFISLVLSYRVFCCFLCYLCKGYAGKLRKMRENNRKVLENICKATIVDDNPVMMNKIG